MNGSFTTGWLEWLSRPQDAPVAVLLAIVALCGLLGLLARREGAGARGLEGPL